MLNAQAVEQETTMRKKGNQIGNIVHESVPVSDNEVRFGRSLCASFRSRTRADLCSLAFCPRHSVGQQRGRPDVLPEGPER